MTINDKQIILQKAFKEIIAALIDLEIYFEIEDMDAAKMKYRVSFYKYHTICINVEHNTVEIYQGFFLIELKLTDAEWVVKLVNLLFELQDRWNSGN